MNTLQNLTALETKIYGLIDPRTNQVRYVGKTVRSLQARLIQHLNERNKHHRAMWIKGLKMSGLRPQIKLLEVVPSQMDWVYVEKKWISFYREQGARLVNKTDGGEGVQGLKHTEESKRKMSQKHKGKKLTMEARQRISQTLKKMSSENPGMFATNTKRGYKRPPQVTEKLRHILKLRANDPVIRKKISDSKLGKPLSQKHKHAISQKHKGKVLTQDHKNKISATHRYIGSRPPDHTGKKRSLETKLLMSIRHKGKKHTVESKQKISFIKSQPLPQELIVSVRKLVGEGCSIRKAAKLVGSSRYFVARIIEGRHC